MKHKTTLSQSIDIVYQKAQYDEVCKKVLAEKIILAWIMKHTITEYSLTEKHHIGKVKEILENEFQIPMTEKMETKVEYMCNLSDGVEQKGIEKGHLRQIKNKLEKNKSLEQIAEEVELDVENVKHYIEILKSN